jgi:uncharacterized protein YbjT (DUF2867 family)
MAERILVTGATGRIGREVIRALHAHGATVRAATRDPETARRLFPADVEVAELDYDATETYDAAVAWVDTLFLMPPPFEPDAYDTIGPFLDWAVSVEVRRVVLLSAMGMQALPALALRKVERHLERLDIAWTILRPNLYMQNFTSGVIGDAIRATGTFELNAGGGAVSFVDTRDVAEVATAALVGGHDGRAYTLTGGEALDYHAAAACIAEVAGRPIAYRPVSATRMHEILRARGWTERRADVAVELFEAVTAGRRAPVHPDLAELLGRAPTPFAAFARDHADAWR